MLERTSRDVLQCDVFCYHDNLFAMIISVFAVQGRGRNSSAKKQKQKKGASTAATSTSRAAAKSELDDLYAENDDDSAYGTLDWL